MAATRHLSRKAKRALTQAIAAIGSNLYVRFSVWQHRAYCALSAVNAIAFFGFSFPVTDSDSVHLTSDSESGDSRRRSPSRTDNKSTNKGDKPGEPELSGEVLAAIGKRTFEERTLAPPLHSELVVRCKDVVEHGLPEEEKANLLKKYPPPENCLFLDPPKLNAEIKRIAQPTVISRDDRIVAKQRKITAALSAVAKAQMTLIKDGKDLADLPVIECLSDTCRLLSDIQRDESMIRRSLVMSNINPTLKDAVSQTACSEWLFGEKLDEIVKTAKVFDATAKDLRTTAKNTPSRSKNSNNPPRQRWKDRQQRTSGGYRSDKPYKRQQAYRSSRPKRREYDNHRRR